MTSVPARLLLSVLAVSLLCQPCIAEPEAARPAPQNAATAVEGQGVGNLYQVCPDLYRSAQPDKAGFAALSRLGIRSVLNLREYHKDNRKASGTGLSLYHYPVAAGKLTESDVENCLQILIKAPKPALVHCMHGSDRTGTIVAAYRIVVQGMGVDDAIAELKEPRFGYHAVWYPNIPALLKSIDWEAMRKRLNAQ